MLHSIAYIALLAFIATATHLALKKTDYVLPRDGLARLWLRGLIALHAPLIALALLMLFDRLVMRDAAF